MTKNHGTPRHWRPTQVAKLSSRLTLAVPQAIRLLDQAGQDPKRLLRFTGDPERLELALAEAFRMLYAGHAVLIPDETVVMLDRSEEPSHHGQIWRGPLDGNGLEGEEQQNQQSLQLEKVNAARFWGMRVVTTGVKRITFPYAGGAIPLDAQVAHALHDQPRQRTLRWLKNKFLWEARVLYFPGTVYRSSKGEPFVCGLKKETSAHADHDWSFRDKLLTETFPVDEIFLYLNI